jgi:hypothetical protein
LINIVVKRVGYRVLSCVFEVRIVKLTSLRPLRNFWHGTEIHRPWSPEGAPVDARDEVFKDPAGKLVLVLIDTGIHQRGYLSRVEAVPMDVDAHLRFL